MGPSDAQLAFLRMAGFTQDTQYYNNVWYPKDEQNRASIRWDKQIQEFRQYSGSHECEWTHDFVLPQLNEMGNGPNVIRTSKDTSKD